MRSQRRFSWTSMSAQASFTRWRSVTSRLYMEMRKNARTTRMTTSTMATSNSDPPLPRVAHAHDAIPAGAHRLGAGHARAQRLGRRSLLARHVRVGESEVDRRRESSLNAVGVGRAEELDGEAPPQHADERLERGASARHRADDHERERDVDRSRP